MAWSDLERYLKPMHFKTGDTMTLTIARWAMEDTHPKPGKTERAPVLYFRERPQGLILSDVNRRILIQLFGDDETACVGQPLTLRLLLAKEEHGKLTQPIRIVRPDTIPSHRSSVSPAPPRPAAPAPPSSPAQSTLPIDLPAPLPTTEAEFTAWTIARGISGQTIYQTLGMPSLQWVRKHQAEGWPGCARRFVPPAPNSPPDAATDSAG